MDAILFQIFVTILGVLFVIACIIGVAALYFTLKAWVWNEFDINLPPKAKPEESFWETLEDSVTPTYVCHECHDESYKRYVYCPTCGKRMSNYDRRR